MGAKMKTGNTSFFKMGMCSMFIWSGCNKREMGRYGGKKIKM